MTFKEYHEFAQKTAIYPNRGHNFVYPALGLSGEAGEVAEKIKKILRDKNSTMDKDSATEVVKELGDVLWYISAMAYELGVDMEDVAKANMEKLQSRRDRNMIHGDGDNR